MQKVTCINCRKKFINYDFVHEGKKNYSSHYCNDCVKSIREARPLVRYHGFNDWKPRRLDGQTYCLYIGFELEVGGLRNTTNINKKMETICKNVEKIMDYDVICSNDSSINSGFEIVSQPMTVEYMLKYKDRFVKLFDYLKKMGLKDDDSCGLHFHVNKNFIHNDEGAINRIYLIMENFKKELFKFSRRDKDNINRWSKFLLDTNEDDNKIQQKKKNRLGTRKINDSKDYGDRYMALNITNISTLEFRLFKSTLDIRTFFSAVELVANIMFMAKENVVRQLIGTNFKKLLTYKYNNYCLDYAKRKNIPMIRNVIFDYDTFKKSQKDIVVKKLKGIDKSIVEDILRYYERT